MARTTKRELTDRQRSILEFIRATHEKRGYPPSVREIGEAVGLQSPSSVHAQLGTLARKGYLQRDPTLPRAIRVVLDEQGAPATLTRPVRQVPLLGRIAAGAPILAQEAVEDMLAISEDLVGKGTLFALRVRGDSMIGDGILDGDTVVIRQQPDADDGDTVAALVNGEEATVKRLHRRRGQVILEPSNPTYEPIEADDVAILGKVIAVLRRL